MSLDLDFKRGFECVLTEFLRVAWLRKMMDDGVLFIGKTYGLKCVKMGLTLCKKKKISVVVRTSIIGYQYLGNWFPILKMVLKAC